MKEYIYLRPDSCTLKEAKHDAFFKGEIIRCKDCTEWHDGQCYEFEMGTKATDFCCWAERKEE